MDEREKLIFQKIYAELFYLIFIGCAVSLIVKFAVFQMDAAACIPEFPILVITPVYMTIRMRMLRVTQANAYKDVPCGSKKRFLMKLLPALFAALLVYAAMNRSEDGIVNWIRLIIFGSSFAIAFIITHILFKRSEEKRQKKLDAKYQDET